MTRISWTEEEKRAVAEASLTILCKRMPEQNPTTVDRIVMQSYYGFLANVVPAAQRQVLAAERHRNLTGIHQMPWIYGYVTEASIARRPQQAVAPALAPAEMVVPVADFDMATFAALLAPLVAQHVVAKLADEFVLTPRVVQRAITTLPLTSAKPQIPHAHKPQVWMLGLLPNQQREIESAWGGSFRFKFIDADRSVKFSIPTGDWAIGMAGFINHPIEKRAREQVGNSRYLAIHGGVTSLKKALSDLKGKINRPGVSA